MMMFEGERWVGRGQQEESGAPLTMIGGGLWKLVSAARESKSGGTTEEVRVRLSWLCSIVADYF